MGAELEIVQIKNKIIFTVYNKKGPPSGRPFSIHVCV
jgi:hypothetical protein